MRTSSTKTYIAWNNMKKRCNQKQRYPHHGGRGITYQESWENFNNFLQDVGECPDNSYTLDRINNDANYTKDNVRWTTRKIQNLNRNIRSDNKLGIVGIQPHRSGYLVTNTQKEKKYLGWYKDFFEACCIRKASELNG